MKTKIESNPVKDRKVKQIILKPAHGRDYDNPVDALNDWDNGKDFEIDNADYHGFFLNKAEFYSRKESDFSNVMYIHFKYDNLSKRKVIKPSDNYSDY